MERVKNRKDEKKKKKGLQRGGIDDIIDEHSRERATGTLKTEQ